MAKRLNLSSEILPTGLKRLSVGAKPDWDCLYLQEAGDGEYISKDDILVGIRCLGVAGSFPLHKGQVKWLHRVLGYWLLYGKLPER